MSTIRNLLNTKTTKKILFYLILLILWQLLYMLNVNVIKIWRSYNFPSPIETAKSFYYLALNHTLGTALIVSLKRVLIGYGISLFLGTVIGFILAHFNFIGESLNGIILGLQTLPNICWIPFAILWFGLNEGSILFVIAIGSTFSIAMAVEGGLKNVNPLYIKAGKNMGASVVQLYYHIKIPAALPYIISGMKQGWSFSWRGLIAGEMLSASKGLGQVLMAGRYEADINQVTVIMLIIVIIGIFVDRFVFGKLEGRIRNVWGISQSRI